MTPDTEYTRRVRQLCAEGMSNGDAQSIADAEGLDDVTPVYGDCFDCNGTGRCGDSDTCSNCDGTGGDVPPCRDCGTNPADVSGGPCDDCITPRAGKVDVLAVMDKQRDTLCNKRDAALERGDAAMVAFWRAELAELAAARAAVAELIEKADALESAVHAENPDGLPFCYRAPMEALRAALAKVQP